MLKNKYLYFSVDKASGTWYNNYRCKRDRGIAQLVEQRSPKPRAEGSSPSAPARTIKPVFREKH